MVDPRHDHIARSPVQTLVFDDWSELVATELPHSCIIHTCIVDNAHCENIEIRISTFRKQESVFFECSSMSWACCTNSKIAQRVESSIVSLYSEHLPRGKWINHG